MEAPWTTQRPHSVVWGEEESTLACGAKDWPDEDDSDVEDECLVSRCGGCEEKEVSVRLRVTRKGGAAPLETRAVRDGDPSLPCALQSERLSLSGELT